MSRLDSAIAAKKEKRAKIEELGFLAHPYSFDKKQSIAEAIAAGEGAEIQTAGRLVGWRTHGRVIFGDLTDDTYQVLQVMFHAERLDEETWEMLKYLDTGDFVGVKGKLEISRTGTLTLVSEAVTLLGKSLRPLPSEWNAAEDKEARFRQRYLDMLVNPTTQKVLTARWKILAGIRRFLTSEYNYTEVETPVLQTLYGGTNARPFTTHMEALDSDFYLRIAPELYLKRLLVGGMERIFEIARNFRNEGIDQTHQPEFTMVEWYHAYGDYQTAMTEIEALIKYLAGEINVSQQLMIGETEINLSAAWPKITMIDALREKAGIEVEKLSDEELLDLIKKNNFQIKGEFSRGKAIFTLFDKLVTPKLISPTWIIDYPREVSPLAKKHRLHLELTERYELYIGGKEIADGWSEITDPLEQRDRFENEQRNMRAGDDEAQPMDEEFLAAMEYGLPPLAGVGLGIDRLVMLLTNTWSIREVIAFPTLRRN